MTPLAIATKLYSIRSAEYLSLVDIVKANPDNKIEERKLSDAESLVKAAYREFFVLIMKENS